MVSSAGHPFHFPIASSAGEKMKQSGAKRGRTRLHVAAPNRWDEPGGRGGGFVGRVVLLERRGEGRGWKGTVFVLPPKTLRYCMYPDGCSTRHTRHFLHDVAAPAPCSASIDMAADSRAIRLAAGRRRKDKKLERERVSWPVSSRRRRRRRRPIPSRPPRIAHARIYVGRKS